MGIEHPILGLMTITIILTALVGAVVFLAIYHYNLQQAILSMPLTVGYAQCYSKTQDGNITGIFVANDHRVALYLTKVWVGTEAGPIEVIVSSYGIGYTTFGDAKITVWTEGFHERVRLLQGQPGTVWVQIRSSNPLHLKGKVYAITLYFKVEGQDAFITQEARVKPGETPKCAEVPIPPITLILSDRAAKYYDTFDTNPFPNRLEARTCTWSYDTTRKAVSIAAGQQGPSDWGYWCVAYIRNLDIESFAEAGETIYIAFLAFRSSYSERVTIRAAALYLDPGASRFYTIGYSFSLQSGRTGDIVSSVISVKPAGGSEVTVSSTSSKRSLTLEYWYLSHISTYMNFSAWKAFHWNQTFEHQAIIPGAYQFYPTEAGIGYWVSTTGVVGTFYFDNLVVTVGRPAWIVEVRNLSAGWSVRLLNSTGHVIASATADSEGVARLVVAPSKLVDMLAEPNNRDGFIFPNGIIEVYDENGYLVVRRQFDVIVGGDVYELKFGT
ncbi:MAG: hypothetical protein P3X22_006780 [Thermoprotei archaeon]|nr:hypothetical protein [Thermoprotei archaeon]